ncbi:PAS sensor protein [Natrinema pellirubrum DSM 15624]|uniref:PAS sensor protein n=1 Tax=Natrinema pellirubrum (strain DSM 15624 / CIP 106293 / JCM 10476 / NCIMB 786 / 157) TaxID=797303 RepID=L9Z505_NATP1|nr:bacterio-opsin activator domain-containing protein [Natrinema pellirubrum]ELY81464.1 PAS sensor protein [Natrinema pellirubrum DSM 15624]
MSDAAATVVGDSPCILIVGESSSADDAMDALAGAFAEQSLLRARTAVAARERLAEREIHCLVCPFDPDERSDSPSLLEGLADRTDAPIVALADGDDADRALEAGASDVASARSATVLRTRVRNAADRERYRRAASAAAPRHRAILESADAVVWVVDDEGTVKYVTPAVESRLGYTPAELERTALTRLVHPDDREGVRDAVATAVAGPTGTTERVRPRLGHADGTWRVATLTCTNRLADPALEGVVVTRTDAEPTVDAGGADAVRTGLDRLTDPLFVLGADDDVRYANAAATRFVRRFDSTTTDEPLPTGAVLWDRLPDALGRSLSERVREAERTGSVTAFETTVPSLEDPIAVAVHPGDDGATIHVRNRPAEAVETDRDRLALLESVIDTVDVGIAVLEGSTIRLANPALLELADAASLVGRDLESVFDDDLAASVLERADSPVVRWLESVSGTLATEPPRPVDVSVAPLSPDFDADRDTPAADRTLCVVRDGRESGDDAASMLRRTTAALASAEAPSAVRHAVVDAVGEWMGADVTVWYRGTDDDLRPTATVTADHTGSDDASIEPPAIDPRGTRLEPIIESGEPTVDDREAFTDVLARTGLRAERVLAVPVGSDGIVLATSTEPTAFDGIDVDGLEALSAATAIAHEDRDRAAALRTCRHERARLETVVDRDERLWDLGRSLLEAETREAVEERLCEGLVSLSLPAAADGVGLAWVGRADDGRERLVPTAWAGRDAAFLESATVALNGSEETPARAAATTREAVVVDDLATGDAMGAETTDRAGEDSWRRRLRDRGFRSALSVPLTADEFRFGTLTAYATEPGAFDERTRRACAHLGTIAGAAIGALETKAALLADRVTELEVVCRDETEPLSSLAGRLERRIDVRAVIPRSTDGSTVYCSISDGDSDAIRDRVATATAVESVTVVGDGDDRTALEIVFAAPTVAGTIAAHGGVLRSLEPVDDRTRLTIELGEPVEVRAFVRALERRHPGTELIARRTRERPPRAAGAIDDLAERLSERQRRTLEAAYHGGFFEWPRDHTGEEIADSLGISQPTFSRHLRLAQRKLFALLFDDADGE